MARKKKSEKIDEILKDLEDEKNRKKGKIAAYTTLAIAVVVITVLWIPVYNWAVGSFFISGWIENLKGEADARSSAIRNLIRHGDLSFEPLKKALTDRAEDTRIRAGAAYVVGEIKEEKAIEALVSILAENEEDPELRKNCALALGEIRNTEAVDALADALEDKDNETTVREAAAVALSKMTEAPDERVVNALVEAFKDRNLFVRAVAAEAIGKLGAEAIEPLWEGIRYDYESSRLRDAASSALGRMDGTGALEILESHLEDKKWKSRAAAAWIIGELFLEEAVEKLCKILDEDRDLDVRIAAANALGKIGSKKATPYLHRALQDEYIGLRLEVIKALGLIKDRSSIGPLTKLLRESRMWSERAEAATALGKIGGRGRKYATSDKTIEHLIAALGDNDFNVRKAASEALAAIGRTTIEYLWDRGALSNENWKVRFWAVKTLGGIGDKGAVPMLIVALNNEVQWEVKQQAAASLGELGDPRAVNSLINALGSDRFEIRYAAAEALGKIGDTAAVEPMVDALSQSEDPDFKGVVAESLQRITGKPLGLDVKAWREYLEQQNRTS